MANTQLVLGAQKDPYNAEVFRLLAENMIASASSADAAKAKACAERAKLLNPSSQRTAKLLYEIQVKQVQFFECLILKYALNII